MNCLAGDTDPGATLGACLRAADALIVASSGVAEWRPLFVLGLQSVGILAVGLAIAGWAIWRAVR